MLNQCFKFVRITCCVISFALSVDASCQKLTCRHITTEDGLPSQFVSSILRDYRGFMWFGTSEGLCRYDGNSLKLYNFSTDSTGTMADNHISTVFELNPFELMVGTLGGGLKRFNTRTEKFISYKNHRDNPGSISDNQVNIIYRDRNGTIWIGTHHGLNSYHDPGEFKVYKQAVVGKDDPCNQVRSILEDENGELWIGTGNGLFRFDREKENFIQVPLNQAENSPGNAAEIISCLAETHDGTIWVGTQNYLYVIRGTEIHWMGPDKDRSSYPANKNIMDMAEIMIDGEFQLWIATQWGLSRFNHKNMLFEHFYNHPEQPDGLSANDIRKLFYNSAGFLWMAVHEHGIDVASLRKNQPFHRIQIHGNNFGHSAACFCEDDSGNLWVGSHEGGLLKYDRDMKFISRFNPRFPDNSFFSNGRILRVLEDHSGRIWTVLDSPRFGVFEFEEASGLFHEVRFDTCDSRPAPSRVRDITEDQSGILWVATTDGLYFTQTGEIRNLSLQCIKHEVLSRDEIWDVLTDKMGTVWVAAQSGLYCILKTDHDSLEIEKFKYYSQHNHDSYIYPRCIMETLDHEFWIGTNRNLCRLNRENYSYSPVDLLDEGLNNSFIISILEDNSENLWINHSKGLLRFDPAKELPAAVRSFDSRDGLPYDGYISTPLFRDLAGKIFIPSNYGTQLGFFYFHPDSIPDNTIPPAIVISDFKVNNESFDLDTSITAIHRIYLNHKQNFFSFEFSALDYADPARNQFAYFLQGLDKDWIYCGTRNYANYTGVPPGDYIFKVKGSNNNGYWNEKSASVSVHIAASPWKSRLAIVIYSFTAATLIFIFIRFYLKRKHLRQILVLEKVSREKLLELDRMKSRFFANISHEFRTPLTLILGPLQKLISEATDDNKKEELHLMQRNAMQLKRLISQLLNLARLEAGKMKLQCGEYDIVRFINEYVQSFESQAKNKNIHFTLKSETGPVFCWFDKEKIEQVMNNLLSNAFKFTPEGGRIEVTVGIRQSEVVISVSDTGTGITPRHLPRIFDRFYQAEGSGSTMHEGTGIGLAISKELVELHHGSIKVDSKYGEGSCFTFYLPMGNKHLSHDEMIMLNPYSTVNKEQETDSLNRFLSGDFQKDDGQNPEIQNHLSENGNPLLLIVEDNHDMRHYIRGYFRQDFQVLEAGDGLTGIQAASEHVPDIIISDVMMPGMDGNEFCRRIKDNEVTCHIPVIMLTARASRENRLEGLESGADDFITKPFDGEELVVRVKNIILQRYRLKERFRKEFESSGNMPLAARLSMDQKFLQGAIRVIENHLSDPDFSVQRFAGEMALSRTQLHRKLKAIVNRNATEFIQVYRLNKAAEMLRHHTATIAEIAYDVGFSSPSYFSLCFKKQFGISPTEYSEQKNSL